MTLSSPRTSVTWVFHSKRIFSWARARSCMILDARSVSRRWMTVTVVGEAREEQRLFHGRVATADDGDVLAAKEEAVARRARGEPVAQVVAPRRGRSASASVAPVAKMTASAVMLGSSSPPNHARKGRVVGVEAMDLLDAQVRAEARGLLAHAHHQVGPGDRLGEAGVVLDVGREHELAAGLVGRGRGLAFDHDGVQLRASGVDGGGEPGRARANDRVRGCVRALLAQLERAAASPEHHARDERERADGGVGDPLVSRERVHVEEANEGDDQRRRRRRARRAR